MIQLVAVSRGYSKARRLRANASGVPPSTEIQNRNPPLY
jgi:hypothetical protein